MLLELFNSFGKESASSSHIWYHLICTELGLGSVGSQIYLNMVLILRVSFSNDISPVEKFLTVSNMTNLNDLK